MPEDVGGTPFPDGWEPDDDHDHGVSDEEFASVVFDEAFVQAATVHEPTAVERLLAAAQARAEASEAEARRAHARGEHYDDAYGPEGTDFGQDPDDDELEDTYVLGDRHFGGYGKQVRWHRPVAWVLAVVMGIGMVALAFAAVYRGGSAGTRDGVPSPAPTGLEQGSAAAPSVSADTSQPAASAIPRSP
ncbi:membrane protein [Streptomyces incarnatus]|uniref:Membrane protein n=1 Tax=Streptomyces incarnatus TaxID=665007 RepID=A0ABN4GI00_9ACTN|nr:membrane protein [Streptomyces incarnatus]